MEVKLFTPLVRLHYTQMRRTWNEIKDSLAKELELPAETLLDSFSDFAFASSRVVLNGEKEMADFELATAQDNAKTLREKFLAYLNTAKPHIVWQMEQAMNKTDEAYEKAIAPTLPEGSDPE